MIEIKANTGLSNLGAKVTEGFDELGVQQEVRTVIEVFLSPLKHKDPVTRFHYDHSFAGRFVSLADRSIFASQ